MIFLSTKEYFLSKELISRIKLGDTKESIKLINAKNCQKIYLTIHILVLGILSVKMGGLSGVPLLICAAKPIFDIYRSHKVIDELQKNHVFFNGIVNFYNLPRMRSDWFNKIVPWVDCAITDITSQVHIFTIY